MIDHCSRAHVLMMQGWEFSTGVDGEIKYCLAVGKPFYLIDPVTYMHVKLRDVPQVPTSLNDYYRRNSNDR